MSGSLVLALVTAFAVTQLAILTTTVYLHRALSHRALTLSPTAALVCRTIVWVTTGIRPREWVAVHRKHHAFADTEGDPHSPVLLGYLRVQLTNLTLYRRSAADPAVVARYARDLPPDRWDRVLFDRPVLGLGIGVALLAGVFGWWVGPLAGLVHAVTYVSLSAAVNAAGHTFGRRPYPNAAGNMQWLALVTAGEGLHNNHHAAPTSASLALAPGEVDPGWWAIRLLRRTGHATIRLDHVVLKEPKEPREPVAV